MCDRIGIFWIEDGFKVRIEANPKFGSDNFVPVKLVPFGEIENCVIGRIARAID